MRGPLPVLLILLSFAVAACQATTGHFIKTNGAKCMIIPPAEASANWSVFGTVLEVKNCPGEDNQYQERYRLTNGWGIYQEANADYVYFHEISERAFREALSLNSVFADKAKTIELHYPKLKNRPVIFAHTTSASGNQYIRFTMNSGGMHGGGVSEWGWSKAFNGLLQERGELSEKEFRQFFLEKLRAFDAPGSAK